MFKKYIFRMIALTLAVFGLFISSGRGPSVDAQEVGDTITNMYFTDANGNSFDRPIVQWESFRLNVDFTLPDSVAEGDTTTVILPPELSLITSTDFVVKDSDGNIVANAIVDSSTRKITLTYTDYVESHNDVSGSFYFYIRVDHRVVTEESTIPISVTVSNSSIPVGDIEFAGIDEIKGYPIMKSGWTGDTTDRINYSIAINRSKQVINNASVTDTLGESWVSYDKNSFKIYKGEWQVNATGDWVQINRVDVTNQFVINFTDANPENGTNASFTINLGNITEKDGYYIRYLTDVGYTPVDGEVFHNKAVISGDKTVIQEVNPSYTYQEAGGSAEGYTYKINILKTDEADVPLAGAIFNVIRNSTGLSVGTITTGTDGKGSLGGLLKGDYTLKEVQAPIGFEIANDVAISVADFDTASKSVSKTIIDKLITTTVSGIKIWTDNDNQDGIRPLSIIVRLYANEEATDKVAEVSAATSWQYSFTNLPEYKDGEKITYSVKEDAVEGYTTTYSGENNYDITNTHIPSKINILVKKNWDDNNDEYGKRPDKITIKLLADGEIEKTQIITPDASGDWKYSFTDLPEYKNGNKIVYSIEEDAVEGYKLGSIVEETTGNFIITNTVEKEYSLPKTGGRGTLLYTIAGSFISLAAIILLVLKYRRPKKI